MSIIELEKWKPSTDDPRKGVRRRAAKEAARSSFSVG